MRVALFIALSCCLMSCQANLPDDEAVPSRVFPSPARAASGLTKEPVTSEATRDNEHEAADVITAAAITPGMTVADIGAGEGYYTVRLATKVGKKGRVLAEDIVPALHDSLALRVSREHLDNVSVKLGKPADPSLPNASFDRIFMIDVYHEIESPFEFLWRMRPSLNKGGQIVVVDHDRAINRHGITPALMICEFNQIGYQLVDLKKLAEPQSYIARFNVVGDRPKPEAIKPCTL